MRIFASLNKSILVGAILSFVCGSAVASVVVDERYSAQGFRRFEVTSKGFKNLCKESRGAGTTIVDADKVSYFCTAAVFTQEELIDQGLAQVNIGPSLLYTVETASINLSYLKRGIRFEVLPYDWYFRPYTNPSPAPIKLLQTNELQLRVVCNLKEGCTAADLQRAVGANVIKTFVYQIDLFPSRDGDNGDFDPNAPCKFGCGG